MEEDQQFKLHRVEDLLICPSFSSYSTNEFADIAAKVAKEVVTRDAELGEVLSIDEDSDLEFSFACCDEDLSTAAEEYGSRDGEFRYVFPIFNGDLRIRENRDHVSTINVSLKKLFLDEDKERDLPSSSSSSEIDELESIPPESYCVWKPREAEASPITCKKSRSTGSGSKRWKLRDLLYHNRSNSDGKSAFIFLREKPKSAKVEISDQKRNLADGLKKPKEKRASSPANSNMLLYSRNRATKEGERRKSYLPYRKDLIGFFTTVNGIGRSFHHF